MSVRQALKRSLAAAIGSDAGGASDGLTAPTAAKRARKGAGKKVGSGARAMATSDLPRIELEEDIHDEEDSEDFDDGQDVSEEESGSSESEQDTAAIKPLKKRLTANIPEKSSDQPMKPGKSYTAGAAAADDAIEDFDDGYGSDLMGDEEDRDRLAGMTELEREMELSRRHDARVIGQQNVALRRQLHEAERLVKARANADQPKRGAARAQAASSDDDSDASESARPKRAATTRGRGRGRGRGGAGAGRLAKKQASDSDESASSDGSDSSASGSSSSESDDSSASDASDNEDKAPTRGKKQTQGSAAANRRKAEEERKYRLYGSDSEGDDDESDAAEGKAKRSSRDVDVSLKAIKGAHKTSGRWAGGTSGPNIDMYLSDSSDAEFVDDEEPLVQITQPLARANVDESESLPDSAEAPLDFLIKHAFLRKRQMLTALVKPYFRDLIQGAFIRVAQPVAQSSSTAPTKNVYRIARVIDYVNLPRAYDPWYGATHLKSKDSGVEKTHMALHIAIGSSMYQTGSTTAKRVVELFRISDSVATQKEWDEYRKRCAEQYKDGSNPDDLPPTVGELRRLYAKKKQLIEQASFTPSLVDKSIKQREEFAFTEAKLQNIPNLAYIKEHTTLTLEQCQHKLGELSAESADYRKVNSEVSKLKQRLAAIEKEELRRREQYRSKEKEKLAKGRDVSSLTRLLNTKIDKQNRIAAEFVADAERGKSGDVEAEVEDDNPYLRRRTAPIVMWNFGGQQSSAPVQAAAVSSTAAVSTQDAAHNLHDGVNVAPATLDSVLAGPEEEVPVVQNPTPSPPAASLAGLSLADMRRKLGLA